MLPQNGPIGSPQLGFPVACSFWADRIAAERPIPSAWTRGHTQSPDLLHAFAAVPPMLHGRIRVRQQSRVGVYWQAADRRLLARTASRVTLSFRGTAQLSVQHAHAH